MVQFSSVQLLSRVWLFATPWIAAGQASLSITISPTINMGGGVEETDHEGKPRVCCWAWSVSCTVSHPHGSSLIQQILCVCVCVCVRAQLYPAPCDPMDYSPPGSSVHGISQARILESGTWKQSRCPSADEWIRKLWYIYTMEYYSAIKKNTFESVLMRWMKLEPII